MFKTEKEMVYSLISSLKSKYDNSYITEEVKTSYWTITDVVLSYKSLKFSFEAKLNSIIDVWVQALRNKKLYDYSYVVLPYNKKNIIMKKHINNFKKYNLGLILINNKNELEFLNKIEDIL